MPYIYKAVQGEDELNKLIRRMKGENAKVRFCETIGHCDEITVEMIYLSSPKYEGYRQWFLLYMQSDKGTFGNVSDMRKDMVAKVEGGKL